MNNKKLAGNCKSWFTLVELIVVISILAILATIAFISYSDHLVWSRNTNRLSQLTNLNSWLEVYWVKNTLPIPESNVEVRASWSVIGYQWIIWKNILAMIEYSQWGKDPKDEKNFTYFVTTDKKYFQLMAFLENDWKILLTKNNNLLPSANAADYSSRFPSVMGSKLWILTETWTNLPIQEVSSVVASWYVDVVTTTKAFRATFTDIDSITWTWIKLAILNKIPLNNLDFDKSLIGFWDMETVATNWKLVDLSWNWNYWTCYNLTTLVTCWAIWTWPQVVDWNWKTWKAMSFDWIDDNIILSKDIALWNTNWTTLVFTKTTSISPNLTIISNQSWWPVQNLIWLAWWKMWYHHYNGSSWLSNTWSSNIAWNSYNLLTWRNLSTWTMKFYINSTLDLDSFNSLNWWPVNIIWKHRSTWMYYNWIIDEIRIYSRDLSDSEIQAIYDSVK